MKRFTKKLKLLYTACFAFLVFGVGALFSLPAPVQAGAQATLPVATNGYTTDGASVRVFKRKLEGGNITLSQTDKQGIRFHVQTVAGYTVNGTSLLDVTADAEKNENGSFKLADGYKTYTLVIPTRLLSGDLTLATNQVMKIDTSKYWFADEEGNWESVAYIYEIPESMYTDSLSFRGIICDSNDNVVTSTAIAERSLAYVAKMAYKDTIKEDHYWGSAALDDQAAPLIKQFVPTYSITYKDAEGNNLLGEGKTEEVLWGDIPQNVPTNAQGSWYDTTASEEFDVSKTMSFTANRDLTLVTTSSNEFLLTGVATQASHTIEGATYSGIKVYATLPTEGSAVLAYNTKLDIHAVNVEYTGTGTFEGFQGVWTMQDGSQMRLFFAFKENTHLIGGDKILIKGDSVFYANGIMYKLTQDYTVDYNGADYGMFLGYLYSSDVKSIYNYSEERAGATVNVIRVEFYRDVLINSDYTFVYDGDLPDGVSSPVYLKCGNNNTTKEIAGGYYYWNNGEHKLIELNAYGCGANNDELHAIAGTKIVQNGGYYIFSDTMYAYYNGTAWVNGKEMGKFTIDEFAATGENHTKDTNEIRINTNTRWWDTATQLTAEKMDGNAEYAVYYTSIDGTVTPLTSFIFHGQEYTENGTTSHHQIFGIRETTGKEAGDTITITKGTRFWRESEYYTFNSTTDLVLYFNGSYWVVNHDGTPTGMLNSSNFTTQAIDYDDDPDKIVKSRFILDEEIFNVSSPIAVEGGSIKIRGMDYASLGFVVRYHAGGNKIIEISKDITTQAGLNAFTDTIVFEKGTRLWIGNVCYEMAETVTFVYMGATGLSATNSNMKANWVQSTNTNVTKADIISINYYDPNEIRIKFVDNIITDLYYGASMIDASKGLPIVNGVEVSANSGWSYSKDHDLLGIFSSCDKKAGDMFIIPAGCTWWTTQGSITFTQEICAIYPSEGDSKWSFVHKTNKSLGTIGIDEIMNVNNEGTTEIRIKIPLGYSESYYGLLFLDGEAYVTKADGSKVTPAPNFWYGGQSSTYTAEHSLIGFRGVIGENNGDQFIIKAGAKLFLIDGSGYHTFDKDVVYTFLDNSWQKGNLHATIKTTTENATVKLPETADMFAGREYSFSATANDGYAITSVTANGTELTANNGTYTFTLIGSENNIKVTAKKLYTVTVNAGNTTVSGIANGEYVDGTAINFTASDTVSHTVTNVTVNGNSIGTAAGSYSYTVTGKTDISVDTVEKAKYTVSWTNPDGATISVSANETGSVTNGSTVYAGQTLTVTVTATDNYRLNTVTIGGTSQSGVNTTHAGSSTFSYTVKAATAISATTVKMYAVSYSGTNATITVTANGSNVSNNSYVDENTTISVSTTPDTGYHVTGVLASGNSIGTINGTHKVTSDTTISNTAALNEYTVTWTNPTSATISVNNNDSGSITVTHGTNISVTITPKSGYRLDTVSGIGSVSVDKTHNKKNTFTYTVTAATEISATTVKMYQISWTTGYFNISGVTNGDWYDENSNLSVTITPNANYAMTSIKVNGGNNLGSSTYMTAAETISVTVSGATSIVVTTEAYPTISITPDNATVTLNGKNYISTTSVQLPKGSYTVKVANRTSDFTTYTVTNVSITGSVSGTTSGTAAGNYKITITGDVAITVTTSNGGCLVEGTLVTLADGTQKAVENLQAGDMLLVFNHETGEYDVAPLLVNTHATAEANTYTVISLYFSNGNVLRIADEHAVFSKTENKYVYINASNAYEFIGDEFVSSTYVDGEVVSKVVTLNKVTVVEEYTRIFTPVSAWHMNVVADNMLTLSGRTVNFFEYNETMKYDEEKMQADIEKYGLYTYEDFKDYVSEEVFHAFPFKYFKVAIEKGEYTWEELMFLLSEYNEDDSEK